MNAVLSWKHRKTERSTERRGDCSIIQEQQRHQFPWFGGVNVLWVRDLGWSNESSCAIWKQFSIADHVIVRDESTSNLLVIRYFLNHAELLTSRQSLSAQGVFLSKTFLGFISDGRESEVTQEACSLADFDQHSEYPRTLPGYPENYISCS